mmetsp:Transcript_16815/g.14716  ORF Transcript_16815/g.14716 Transcript_16815/m.14716 type:complete len:213 (-) Transcript_16815:935-1573(-)
MLIPAKWISQQMPIHLTKGIHPSSLGHQEAQRRTLRTLPTAITTKVALADTTRRTIKHHIEVQMKILKTLSYRAITEVSLCIMTDMRLMIPNIIMPNIRALSLIELAINLLKNLLTLVLERREFRTVEIGSQTTETSPLSTTPPSQTSIVLPLIIKAKNTRSKPLLTVMPRVTVTSILPSTQTSPLAQRVSVMSSAPKRIRMATLKSDKHLP